MLNLEANRFTLPIYYFRPERHFRENWRVKILLSNPCHDGIAPRSRRGTIEDEELFPLRLKGRQFLLLPHAACRIVGVHVGIVAFPETNEMASFCPVARTHAGDHLRAGLESGFRGGHRFCLDELAKSIRAGDRFEKRPGGTAVFRSKSLLDRVGAHLHRGNRLVDPCGHDIRHAGRTAAGGAYGLLRAAGNSVGLLAPALIALLVIDRLLAAGSRSDGLCRFCNLLVLASPERQPVVCVNAAGLLQSGCGLERKDVCPRIVPELAVNGSADERLDCFDIDTATVVLVRHSGQGLCQGCQRLRSGDTVHGQSVLALESLRGCLLLDGKGVLHG